MQYLEKIGFFKLIIAGLTLRLLLALLPGFQFDMGDWLAWAVRLDYFNFSNFYSKDFFTDYTPGYLYVLSLLGFLKSAITIPDNTFYFLLKIPAIIAELAMGILIYKEVKSYLSKSWATIALVLIIFNPALFFNSSVWGQVDSISTLLMVLTVLTLKNNHLIKSSIFFGLALLVKPQAIALLPLFVFFLIRNLRLANLFKLLIPGLLVIFIFSYPFFPDQTLISLGQHIINSANTYPYTSVNAYNFWGIGGFWISDKPLWNNLSYNNWGYILLSVYWIIIAFLFVKKRLSIYAVAALATLGFFFFPTRVHERYLYPAIIFLILLSVTYKSKLLLFLTGLLSLLHFLNLYYVYIYYNEFFLKLPKTLYNPFIYNILETNGKSLSFISVTIFIFITLVIINRGTIFSQSSKIKNNGRFKKT